MNPFGSLWLCYGSEYPKTIGISISFPERLHNGRLNGEIGLAVGLLWRYVAIEWRFYGYYGR